MIEAIGFPLSFKYFEFSKVNLTIKRGFPPQLTKPVDPYACSHSLMFREELDLAAG